MAKGEQQNLSQRRVVGTLENANKYNMPDPRRLRVQADTLNINVAAEDGSATRLARSLAEISPALMTYAVDKDSDANAVEVNQGRQDALQGLSKDEEMSEWRRHGYEHQSAILIGEDLGAQLQADIQTKDPEVDFDQWYQEWWETNGKDTPTSPEAGQLFNRMFTKSVSQARAFDIQRTLQVQLEQQSAVATESMYRAFKDARNNGLPITTSDWSALKSDLKGFTNAQTDGLFYNALSRYAKEYKDPDALNVLYEPRGEVPALIDNPKYTQQITALRSQLVNAKGAEIKALKAAEEKKVKEDTAKYEQSIRLRLIETTDIEDPVVRSKAVDALYDEVALQADSMNFSTGFINALGSNKKSTDKQEASEYQDQNFRLLYTSNASNSAIDRAVADGDITSSHWSQLTKRREANIRRATTRAKAGKPKDIAKVPLYKRAVKELKANSGHVSIFATGGNADKRRITFSRSLERFTEAVEENQDSGLDDKEAINQALESTNTWMEKTGLMNNQAKEIDRAISKQDNPVDFYIENLEEFSKDYRSKSGPAMNLSDEQYKAIAGAAKLEAARRAKGAKVKPKTTPSTTNQKVN